MLTIDRTSGVIGWGAFRIHPAMTEGDLLRNDVEPVRYGGAHVANDRTYTQYVIQHVPVDGGSASVNVHFENQGLTHVTISFRVTDDDAGWEWSAEQERRRQRVHEAYLERALGKPMEEISLATSPLEENPFTHRRYVFAWGIIGSTYDGTAGFATIYIRYA